MALIKAAPSPWRPCRQALVKMLNSISDMLSQSVCLGVWRSSKRLAMRWPLRWKGLVRGGHAVDVQVAEDDADRASLGVSHVHQSLRLVSEALHDAVFRNGHVAPARSSQNR